MTTKIHSLYYHNPEPHVFERMIRYHLNHGYRFITLNELYEILTSEVKPTERLAFISLDDGWKTNIQLIPVIEKYQVPICCFITTEPLDSGNFWWEFVLKKSGIKAMFEFKKLPYEDFRRQLNEIKRSIVLERSALSFEELHLMSSHPLVTIQSHSVNHPILTKLPDDLLKMELLESKTKLEQLTGKDISAFAYPNGSITPKVINECSKYYKLAFTVEQNHISMSNDLFHLPRYALTGQYYRDLIKIWGIWKYTECLRLWYYSLFVR